MTTDTPLVINIDTGVVSFRTEENAQQCNCRPISKRHALMVESGELEIKPLLAAIKKHMMSSDDFNYEEYAESRRKLNVRHTALHADNRETVKDADAKDYISDKEIQDAAADEGADAVEAAAKEVEKMPRSRGRSRAKATASDADEHVETAANGELGI